MRKESKYEEEIIRYVDGLKVSEEFLNDLETNAELKIRVSELKSDLFLMEKLVDSEMLDAVKNKSSVKIKNGSVESVSFFTKLTPLAARGDEVLEIYVYRDLEISKSGGEYYINVANIKKRCVIEYNNEKIANLFGEKENYSMELKKGNYNIKIDDYESDIIVE